MPSFVHTALPLPEGFRGFAIEGVGRDNVRVQGYTYDPERMLVEEGTPVVLGAGNTYGTNPHSGESLHVAHALHAETGLPVVSLETFGAHGRRTHRLSWGEGSTVSEHCRGSLHRETMLTLGDELKLFARPLHHEGHSQGAFLAAARLAMMRTDDGFDNRTATLYDPMGMRWYPKVGVVPKVASVIRDYEKNHKEQRRPFEPMPEEIAAYVEQHPELAQYRFPHDINPAFVLERVGARPFTPDRLLISLLRNPALSIKLISCARGNGAHTSVKSDAEFQDKADHVVGEGRLEIISPMRQLHQWADRPLNRARLLGAVIRGENPRYVLDKD